MTRAGCRARALIAIVLALIAGAAVASASSATAAARTLRVAGNRLVDGQGRRVTLRGVNRFGTEYACVQRFGIFDGPHDAASVRAIARWHVNFVRVPLNEDCWLGINRIKPAYSGQNYRRAIVQYVQLLHRQGIHVELSLIWGAPGHYRATFQPRSPDEDHSPAMWKSMAATFKNDRDVILAPWGEPVIDAPCLLNGGDCGSTNGPTKRQYRTAGMQQAVRVMRAAGYRGPIAIPGILYANDMTQWLAFEPQDPLGQLVAEAHVYGNNTCSSALCLDQTMAPVASKVPLILGETGETYDASSCGSSHMSTILHWADDHGAGYAATAWNTWHSCLALISNYKGRPAHNYGAFVKGYYAQRAGRP
jgi:hypothetical protein